MNSKSRKSENLFGEHIDFVISKADSSIVKDKKNISGKALNFSLTNVGRWSLEEKKAAVCMICKLSLKADQAATQCPMCQSMFHRNHIVEWLRVKGKCPVCQQNLRSESLQTAKL
ncbi:MAG: RING finger domain-containing protein [Candidatus Heimdallarchaeota archaeon]